MYVFIYVCMYVRMYVCVYSMHYVCICIMYALVDPGIRLGGHGSRQFNMFESVSQYLMLISSFEGGQSLYGRICHPRLDPPLYLNLILVSVHCPTGYHFHLPMVHG